MAPIDSHESVLEVSDAIRIPRSEFAITFARSGGPGGQNVNKTNTKVVLHWNVASTRALPLAVRARFLERYKRRITTDGAIVVQSQRFRDQPKNIGDCLEKLCQMVLAVAKPPVIRKATRRTRSSVERRLRDKHRSAEKKQLRRRLGSE